MSDVKLNDQKIKPNTDLSWQDVNGELVAIDINSGEYHIFNELGRLIWLGIVEGKGVEKISKQIIEQYDVNLEKADFEVKDFIGGLLQRGLLKETIS